MGKFRSLCSASQFSQVQPVLVVYSETCLFIPDAYEASPFFLVRSTRKFLCGTGDITVLSSLQTLTSLPFLSLSLGCAVKNFRTFVYEFVARSQRRQRRKFGVSCCGHPRMHRIAVSLGALLYITDALFSDDGFKPSTSESLCESGMCHPR